MMHYNNRFFTSILYPKNIIHGFGTKGISETDLRSEIPYKQLIKMEQVHGTNIKIIDNLTIINGDSILDVDAVITKLPAYLLTVRTADCLPILCADDRNNIIAAAHCGWKGSLGRLSEKVVSTMLEQGADISSIKVAIGPGIGACCYTIYGERHERFRAEFPDWPEIFEQQSDITTLNLTRLNFLQLASIGVKRENIDFFPFCTSCDTKKFYSYNRDRIKTGMVSFIMQ